MHPRYVFYSQENSGSQQILSTGFLYNLLVDFLKKLRRDSWNQAGYESARYFGEFFQPAKIGLRLNNLQNKKGPSTEGMILQQGTTDLL